MVEDSAAGERVAREHVVARWLVRWVDLVQRHAVATVALNVVAGLALGLYASNTLRFNVDPNALFSDDLRFQQMAKEYSRYFPVLTESLLVVVDGATPETTRDAQERLAVALAERGDAFHQVFLPGEEPFFERTALLYGTVDEVDDFGDHMALLQPVIGELSADPSLPTLMEVVQIGLEELDAVGGDAARWEKVLGHLGQATERAHEPHPSALSWEEVLLADSGFEPARLRVIVAEPILERERVLAAERSIEVVRETARALSLDPTHGVRVRVTGYPALNHEEMLGLTADTALAGSLSLVLVVVVLTCAFRSPRMVLAAAVTLVIGLLWSAAFAGATVVELNPLSIAFGVLVIGLGVDYLIHLGMHFAERARAGETVPEALSGAVSDTGSALMLCCATTTVGFLAFVPTDYRGVSDLGLAASGGLIAVLFQSFTTFPALIRLQFGGGPAARLAGVGPRRRFSVPALGQPWAVVAIAGALGCGALALLPSVHLDANVIRLRNPRTESVQAFEDLLGSKDATPWYINALTPSRAEAERVARAARELTEVDRVYTLTEFVPDEQPDKLEILADVNLMLDLSTVAPRRAVPADEQIVALTELAVFLEGEAKNVAGGVLAPSMEQLGVAIESFLGRLGPNPEVPLELLQALLLDPLPAQVERLRQNLAVQPISETDLPSGLVARMESRDGHARVQVYPSGDLSNHTEMVRFVEAIRPVFGDITGLPVNLVESARATWASLREALLLSFVAITGMLLALWRRVGDTLLVVAPLALAVLLTEVSTVVLALSFNFGTVVVLPLLLGIGVDSGVHLVHRADRLGTRGRDLLASTTARAVLFSALTSMASFGTLVLSSHRAIASLGALLVVGMLWTLAANLVLLPALLVLRERRRTHVVGRRQGDLAA